jgi:hypothetical protein
MSLARHPQSLDSRILTIRGARVILDADLAELYGSSPKRLNEQVKRNRRRFPDDFMFQLTVEEKAEVVANCDHLQRLKFSPTRPYVFTEHGAVMLASVLNTPVALAASLQVVRAFVRLRAAFAEHRDLAQRNDGLEAKCDRQFKAVFDAIRALMTPPEVPLRRGRSSRPRRSSRPVQSLHKMQHCLPVQLAGLKHVTQAPRYHSD